MSNTSTRLKSLRKNHGLVQKDIAAYLGITESAYGFYEQGRREVPQDTLLKLADKYNVSLDYITGRSDDPNSFDQKQIPDFATAKDKRDMKKFLEQTEVMFDGVPLSDEDKAKVVGFMEGMFWEAKKMNKRKKKDQGDK